MNGSCPCGCLCCEPFQAGVLVANETPKVAVASANGKMGITALIDGVGRSRDKMRGDNQDAFGCLGVVAILRAKACEQLEEVAQHRD